MYNRKHLNFSQALTEFQHSPAVRNVSVVISVLGEVSVSLDKKAMPFFNHILPLFQLE